MKQMSNKTLILSFHEFLLLMFKREIDGLVFPDELSELSADEKELKEAFGELITDKYIVPDEDGSYRISKELDEILEVLSNASHSFVIYEENQKFPPCYLYRLNLKAVCLRLDEHRQGILKLELTYFEDKIEELMEYNLVKMVIQRFRTDQTEPEKIIMADRESENDIMDKLLEV